MLCCHLSQLRLLAEEEQENSSSERKASRQSSCVCNLFNVIICSEHTRFPPLHSFRYVLSWLVRGEIRFQVSMNDTSPTGVAGELNDKFRHKVPQVLQNSSEIRRPQKLEH